MGFWQQFGDTFVNAIVKVLSSEIMLVFIIIALGYLLGRITIKGVSLGSSGVFIVALLAGILIYYCGKDLKMDWAYKDGVLTGGAVSSIIKNLGLVLFVTGVGFIAGPTFLRNFKKKAVGFVVVGASIILIGFASTAMFLVIDKGLTLDKALGVMMGALTSTPGLSSSQGLFEDPALRANVAAASGLTYPFGVLGVVLFVQLVPKIFKVNMAEEVAKLKASAAGKPKVDEDGTVIETADGGKPVAALDTASVAKPAGGIQANAEIVPGEAAVIEVKKKKRFILDPLGICVFAVAVVLGMLLGSITIYLGGPSFSLGTTGGALIVGLLFGHFGKVGGLSIEVPKPTLNALRELGLIMFLTGSGVEGGLKFIELIKDFHLLFYGMALTLIPMIVGFVIARYAFKMDILNSLGCVCGGMTSTPALGSLIHVAGTDDVAQSYAATYPISLFLLVLAPQLLNLIAMAVGKGV